MNRPVCSESNSSFLQFFFFFFKLKRRRFDVFLHRNDVVLLRIRKLVGVEDL